MTEHYDVAGIPALAKLLGISQKQLRANWDRDAAEQRAAEMRLKRLKAMAGRRGCYLDACENMEADEDESVYLLYVLHYPDPVEFENMDEVEADLNSRPVISAARRS